MRILVLAALILLWPGLAAARCPELPGHEALLDRGADFIIVGEVHGTVELPRLFTDLVCAAAARGGPVIVGIEHTPDNQAALDASIASDGGEAARARLIADGAGWNQPGGRASTAMFALVEAVRALKAQGADVRLVAFDDWIESGTNEAREAAMAANLMEAGRGAPGATVLALTGLGHADATGFTSAQPPFRSMVQFLPADRTLSLAFARLGGETWGCRRTDDAVECRPTASPARDVSIDRGVALNATRPGFGGVYSSGAPFTASPPIRPTPAAQ
jgi:hypothetical protein